MDTSERGVVVVVVTARGMGQIGLSSSSVRGVAAERVRHSHSPRTVRGCGVVGSFFGVYFAPDRD